MISLLIYCLTSQSSLTSRLTLFWIWSHDHLTGYVPRDISTVRKLQSSWWAREKACHQIILRSSCQNAWLWKDRSTYLTMYISLWLPPIKTLHVPDPLDSQKHPSQTKMTHLMNLRMVLKLHKDTAVGEDVDEAGAEGNLSVEFSCILQNCCSISKCICCMCCVHLYILTPRPFFINKELKGCDSNYHDVFKFSNATH